MIKDESPASYLPFALHLADASILVSPVKFIKPLLRVEQDDTTLLLCARSSRRRSHYYRPRTATNQSEPLTMLSVVEHKSLCSNPSRFYVPEPDRLCIPVTLVWRQHCNSRTTYNMIFQRATTIRLRSNYPNVPNSLPSLSHRIHINLKEEEERKKKSEQIESKNTERPTVFNTISTIINNHNITFHSSSLSIAFVLPLQQILPPSSATILPS
ncbi:hypothetical protein B0H15DRAFT_566428 [Mycena belliarum]|uniref:Uncharacterized protein n=1 Tax=Mycena belliarum TaxID=1033014 RepID=A0AAD6XKF2_9AGAR|nr:hypothetical protein B0H15DRAFT_566428 [Mycena belliae]